MRALRALLAGFVLVAGLIAFWAMPLHAATPASGTLTDTQPVIEWTGGPYTVPNLTPVLGEADQPPVCEEGTPTCDVFRFEVNLATADVENDTVTVRVEWADDAVPATPAVSTPDYDLYLYDDETGALVVTQASAANPELITLPPTNRKYRLDIIPFAAMNQPYTGVVRFERFDDGAKAGVLAGYFGAGVLLALALGGIARTLRRG